MSPAVKKWLLRKAKTDLFAAKDRLEEMKRFLPDYRARAEQAPAVWEETYEEMRGSFLDAQEEAHCLEQVIRDLSS